VFFHHRLHQLGGLVVLCRLRLLTALFGQIGHLVGRQHKKPGDEDRLRHLAILVGGGLKGLPRGVGKAVEIEAVVPVGTADQRQAVRADALERIGQAALQMFVKRGFTAGLIVIRDHLVKNRPVAGLLEISAGAEDQPEGIVIEIAADVVVAAFGQRLVLMIGAPAGQLGGRQVQHPLAGALRHHVDEAEEVLIGIAEAEAAADAGLVEGGRARHVESGHALIGVPDIDHAVGMFIGSLDLAEAEDAVPIDAQGRKGLLHLLGFEIAGDDRFDQFLVDGLRAGGIEFFILRIFLIPQQKDHLAGLAGIEIQLDMMGADRSPAVSDRVERAAACDGGRIVPAPAAAEKSLALGVKAGRLGRAGEPGEMVTAFAVFGLVIDHPLLDLHLAGAEVALEIGRVVLGIPKAELHGRKEREIDRLFAQVGDLHPPDFQIFAERDKEEGLGPDAGIGGADDAVAHAMAAGVLFGVMAGGLPRRRPESAAFVVAQVDEPPAGIEGDVVVAVAGQPAQAGIAIKRVAAGGVGDDAEILFTAEIVNPGQGGIRPGDDIFTLFVVKITIVHSCSGLME